MYVLSLTNLQFERIRVSLDGVSARGAEGTTVFCPANPCESL